MSSNPPSKVASAATANPDSDDDYDDLDDAIPELSAPSPPPPPPPAPAAGPPHSGAASDVGDDEDDNPDDAAFAAELAKGMEHLLRELSGAAVPLSEENPLLATSASASGAATPALEGNDGGKEAREIQEAWERVFKQAEGSSSSDKAGAGAGAAAGSAKGGDDFQRTVKETMERLKRSAETSKNDASSAEDPLAALLASLGDASGAGGPGGLGGLDDEGVLESMMDGLMSKEVLFESMKELDLKYPPYLASPEAAKLEPSAKHAYEAQAKLVAEIVKTFEKPSYSDKDEACKAEIRELMGKMQDLGSPPKEVMGEMPEGFELGPDGLPNLSGLPGGGPDGDCVIC